MAEFLRGKRLAFVGDSLSRNMYQSLLCMLTNNVTNEKNVLVVRKMKRFEAFPFESANFPVMIYKNKIMYRQYRVYL